jgi:predicted Zn-dependent peptidase
MQRHPQLLPNGLEATRFTLANGLEIHVVENHAAPVFHFQTWFKVGSKDEKLDPNLQVTGLAHLFEHMMFRGTASHGDGEFDRLLTRAGVTDENATTWLDRTNYYQSLPADALELVMELEADRMSRLKIDEATFGTERDAVLGEYRMGLDDPDTVAFELLYGTAFVKHPYRYTTIGTEDEIKGFTKAKAEYFYRTYYSPNNAVIVVVGDVDPQRVRALAEKYYGAGTAQVIPAVTAEPEPPQTLPRQAEFAHAQLTEPKLLVAWHTPEARHADIPALWLLQSLLTNGRGALLENAWVNAGLASSVAGQLDQFEDPGLLTLAADVQLGKEPAELLGALDRVLAGMQNGLTDAELERARNQLLLNVYDSWKENGELAAFMGEYLASAGDLMFGFGLVERIERVTAAEVRQVAARYLKPTARTTVVGRPASGEGETHATE